MADIVLHTGLLDKDLQPIWSSDGAVAFTDARIADRLSKCRSHASFVACGRHSVHSISAWHVGRKGVRLLVIVENLDPAITRLSEREFRVAQLLAQGKSIKQIARNLGITVSTTHSYSGRIRTKLDLSSLEELIAWSAKQLR